MELNDTFMQGKNKYIVIGFDSEGRPVAKMCEEKPEEEKPKTRQKRQK